MDCLTREDYIKVCSVCSNKSFDPKVGIICGLTNEIADFKGNCSDYSEDANAVKHQDLVSDFRNHENRGEINRGRFALFLVGGIYVFVGYWEAFVILYSNILYGIVDWTIAAVFIGLGIWSYKKASLAMIIGLIFYLFMIILFAWIESSTLMLGFIWKILVILWLSFGISKARAEEAKQVKAKAHNDDLLDQD
jgi:hypothetical protein